MADDNIFLKGNTLRELERLRKQSSGASNGRLHWTKDVELSELEKEYHQLKKQKQELLEKAEAASMLNKIQEYIDHQDNQCLDASLGKLANQTILFKALELTKKRKLMETYNTYRLTGVAFVQLDENHFRFCLDTFYQGQYFEPYYMEIETKEEVKILKHTIPFFIPMEECFKKYKDSDGVKEFVSAISTYLNAFVSRRQQFSDAQEPNNDFAITDFYSTPAFDFVQFTLKFSSQDLTQDIAAKMKYADLNDKLPTEVDLKIVDNDDGELLNNLKEKLLSTDVKKAIMALNC